MLCDQILLPGNAIASAIRSELKVKVESLASKDIRPGLAVILVGERKDSATYVKMKKKACAEVGINSIGIDYSVDVSEEVLISKSKTMYNIFFLKFSQSES